ncbi:MAG: MFS transporter [Pseudomonadota bacterium]
MLALGAGQTLAWASSYYLPAILADAMARDLGLQRSWIFAAFSAALLVSAVLGPLVGRSIDMRGGRGMLCASNLVFAAGLLLLATAQSGLALAAGWLVIGVAMAMGLYDAAFATLTRLLGSAARSPITGVTLMAGFASTIGWPLTAFLESQLGWRGACMAWAAAHLLLALPLHWAVVPRVPAATAVVEASATPVRKASPLTLWLLGYVFAAGWFVSTAMAAHLPSLLQAAGATLAVAVAAAALVGPAQVLARLFEFGLLRRTHPLVSAMVATSLHPLAAVLFVVFGAPAAVFAFLHGAGNGLLTIAAGTLPLVLFGAAGYGRRQGWLTAPARVAQAGAPLLFALLLERLGSAALALTSGLLVLALLALLGIALQLRSRP